MWSPAWQGFQEKSSAIGLNLLRSSSEKMGGISGGNKLPLRLVLGYGLGHVFNDVCASLWFTYLLIFLQKVNHFWESFLGMGSFVVQIVVIFATNNACFYQMMFSDGMSPFFWFDFFANQVHFWKSIFTSSKNKDKQNWLKNAQVLKFNSADAGKKFLNLVTSTMERTIFSCLLPVLWWYRESSKSLTKSSEVLLFWRKKEGLGF